MKNRLRREQILSKLAEVEESIDLVKENMPEEFEEYKKTWNHKRRDIQKT